MDEINALIPTYKFTAGEGQNALAVDGLQITFTVNKTSLEGINYAEIVLYNLESSTVELLQAQAKNNIYGVPISLEAGFRDDKGVIFTGNTSQLLGQTADFSQGFTKQIRFIAHDGQSAYRTKIIKTLKAGYSDYDVFLSVVEALRPQGLQGFKNELQGPMIRKKYPRGRTLSQSAESLLVQLGNMYQASFYFDNNILYFYNEVKTGKASVTIGKNDIIGPIASMQTLTGQALVVTVRLNPAIRINEKILLKTDLIDVDPRYIYSSGGSISDLGTQEGVYTIYKIIHEGDYYGRPWYTKIHIIQNIKDLF